MSPCTAAIILLLLPASATALAPGWLHRWAPQQSSPPSRRVSTAFAVPAGASCPPIWSGCHCRARRDSSRTTLAPAAEKDGRGLDDLKLDESTLDEEERERLASLRSIQTSLAEVEAMERELGMGRRGFGGRSRGGEEEEEEEIKVAETQWSGQAGLDVVVEGQRDWRDLAARRGLAAGDLIALTAFAWIGRATHASAALDLELLRTAFPFYAGWLAAAPLLGAYTNAATASQGDMAKMLAPAWAVSVPFSLALRAAIRGELPPAPFVAVSMAATLLALGAWRAVYVVVNPTSTSEFKRAGVLDGFRMITTLLQRW